MDNTPNYHIGDEFYSAEFKKGELVIYKYIIGYIRNPVFPYEPVFIYFKRFRLGSTRGFDGVMPLIDALALIKHKTIKEALEKLLYDNLIEMQKLRIKANDIEQSKVFAIKKYLEKNCKEVK